MNLKSSSWIYNFRWLAIPFLLVLMHLFSCSASDKNEDINDFDRKANMLIRDWYQLYFKIEERDTSSFPVLSARNAARLSMTILSVYLEFEDAFSAQQPIALKTLNMAYYMAMSDLYKDYKVTQFDDWIKEHFNKVETTLHVNDAIDKQCISEIIHKVNSIFEKAEHLAEKEQMVPSNYVPIRFRYDDRTSILKKWGENPTIVVDKSKINLEPPYSDHLNLEKALYDESLSVYTQSLQLTSEDKWIGDFWSDDVRGLTFTPISRWLNITDGILATSPMPFEKVIKLYNDLSIALYDGSVVCWRYKFTYNLLRPENFINKFIDTRWRAMHHPDFPSYPSGHSVFGSAAVAVLEFYFGNNREVVDDSHQGRREFFGEPRKFKNLEAMAKENAYSRFLIGVHYLNDCEKGMELGRKIGEEIAGYSDRYINSTTTHKLNCEE